MHPLTVLLLGVISFALAFLLTPCVRTIALRLNLLDAPDFRRKIHNVPIPRVGGVAVMLAYFGSFSLLFATLGHHIFSGRLHPATVATILLGAAIVFIVGLADDIFELTPVHKLVFETAAAVLVVSMGVTVHIGNIPIPNWLEAAITIAWIVGCTNAVNLIDGLDGLATGIALVAALTTLAAALLSSQTGLLLATVPLAGALSGFLLFNFNPASIFLGDSGSLTIGFLLGSCTVIWSAKSATVVGCSAPVIALAVPLMDVGLAFVRRFLRKQPVFMADRGHIHHRLLARGIQVRGVALLLYGVASFCSLLALLLWRATGIWSTLLLVPFVIAVAFGIHYLGYAELHAARRVLFARGFRRVLNTELSLETFQQELRAAATPEDGWNAIRGVYPKFGFTGAEMGIAGIRYSDGSKLPPKENVWNVQIHLIDGDYVTLGRARVPSNTAVRSAAFVDAMQSILVEKLPQWQCERVERMTTYA